MSGALFFSLGTVGLSTRNGRKPSTLLQAARHNQRHQQNERGARSHIDPALTHHNERLAGPDTPEGVAALALALMAGAGVDVKTLRKDYVQAVELLFSLPPDTAIDTGVYFRQCVAWTEKQFGATTILGADIHRDESAPHCHILVLPLVNGRMCAKVLKTREALAKLRASFTREVAVQFGFKPSSAPMTSVTRGIAARAVLQRMESANDPAMKSPAWQVIRREIERNPSEFAEALGIDVATPRRNLKSFAAIMTSKGRATAEDRPSPSKHCTKTIAFESNTEDPSVVRMLENQSKAIVFEAKNHQRLSCVAFAKSTIVIEPPEAIEFAVKPEPQPCSETDQRPAHQQPATAPNLSLQDHGHASALEGGREFKGTQPWALTDIAPKGASALQFEEGVIRERDSAQPTGQWCEVLGEFARVPTMTENPFR